MLSFLPALLIMVFQGPSGLERMALDGRLPEVLRTLAAVRAELEAGGKQTAGREALARLLEARGPDSFSRVLAKVLQCVAQPEPNLLRFEPGQPDGEAGASRPLCPRSMGTERPGFLTSGRTRDGPILS